MDVAGQSGFEMFPFLSGTASCSSTIEPNGGSV